MAHLRNRIYYAIKPFLPLRLRMRVRSWHAHGIRRRSADTWPIDQAAVRPPANWPGWPTGKEFAVVLTHDIEGPRGLAQVRRLAELEMAAGFRSSFNFVPEGTYPVPSELRSWLVENGFEVGVHDLHHDGHLYASKRSFEKNATRINSYLKNWNAVGFRSGFMRRNLDWIHQLDIAYDASTFDTDPFEPQPDGCQSIFPFWIPHPTCNGDGAPGPARPGYVELPYTLPQDSTLFLVLGEKNNSIWRTKTEWLARHHGMVLVNVHPDYVRFADESDLTTHTFPVSFYQEFLSHVAGVYKGRYWHALPKEVAARVNAT